MRHGFWSYAVRDDAHLEGQLSEIRAKIQSELAYLIGQDTSIFQDKEDIRTGDKWAEKILGELKASEFLITVLTPTYFTREWCQREVNEFLAHARRENRNPRIFPIRLLHDLTAVTDDPVREALNAFQYKDFTNYRDLSENQRTQLVRELANEIALSLAAHAGAQQTGPSSTGSSLDVAQLVDAMSDRAREFGIKEAMLIALAKRYAAGNPENFDTALAELERALESVSEENESSSAKSNVLPDLDDAISRIDSRNESGDLEGAQKILNAEVESMEAKEHQLNAIRSRLYEKGVAQAILIRDADEVCRFILAGINMVAPNPQARHFAHRMAIQGWSMRGEILGLKFDLEVAECLARNGVEKETLPVWHANMISDLGRVLCVLGQIELGRERLNDSIETSRAAAEQFKRLGLRVDWARAHINIGAALHALSKYSPIYLEESENAFKRALAVLVREKFPEEWAGIQSNIGNVYHSRGVADCDIAAIKKAILAHQSALEQISKQNAPDLWVSASINLAIAMLDVAERELSVEVSRDAENVLREAHKVAMSNDLTQLGGRAQNYLGLALFQIGEFTEDADMLESASPELEDALDLHSREDTPRDWARTQMSIGRVQYTRGKSEAGLERLQKAVFAFNSALKVWTEADTPHEWANSQLGLGEALYEIGRRKRNTDELREAVTTFECALKHIGREDEDRWVGVTFFIAETQHLIAERDNDGVALAKAAENFAALQLIYTQERLPIAWAEIQSQLGRIFVVQGHTDESSSLLHQGISALRDAYEVLTLEDGTLPWALGHSSLGNGLVCLGRLEKNAELIEQGVSAYQAALTSDLYDEHPKMFAKLHFSIGLACADLCKPEKDDTHGAEAIIHIQTALKVLRKIGEIELTELANQKLQELTAS